jgi:hypothetical protein
LPAKAQALGYDLSRPIYAAARGQLLHWGGVMARYRTQAAPRNDVRAFDLSAGGWVSDYPIAAKCPHPPAGHGAAPRGVSYYGVGEMLPAGTPWPSLIVSAVCYDSKRDQVIYTMRGLMAAYDPKTRKWRDLRARTVLDGIGHPGGPPVYGAGTCYDAVNDEVLLFPHFSGTDCPKNVDLRGVTGEVSGHLGTLRYSFRDNTWRRAGRTFGSAEVQRQRQEILAQLGRLSAEMDAAYAKRRSDLQAAADLGRRAGELRALRAKLDGPLRSEPPARCAAPMVYDPKNEAIVLFGGHSGLVRADVHPSGHLGSRPGALNDTWLYDCRTRQWRELQCKRRPPPQVLPALVYDPASGLVLLVNFTAPDVRRKRPGSTTLWSLDVATGQWHRRGTQEWPWAVSYRRTYAARTPIYNVGLDERNGLLVSCQNVVTDRKTHEQVFVMRLDVAKLPSEPAPEHKPAPPIVPQAIPPDDPQWVATLKALPANTWTPARPKSRQATRRDWGNAACDPVRGHVYYFGGGHATYQVNDVAIYAVGANRWVHAAGDHNDFIPAVGWGGITMGFRGGRHAHHQRNQYVALGGRMYVSTGGVVKMKAYGRIAAGQRPGPRYAWFYDLDRGGVWRQQRIAEVRRGKGVDGVWGAVHVADPAGKVLGLVGDRTEYYGATYPSRCVSVYDVYANTLEVRKVPAPFPQRVPECRPFCFLADRGQVFFYEHNKRTSRQGTWLYNVKSNRFVDCKPKRQPPGMATTVEYLDGQDAVYAVIDRKAEWVYSLKHNTWAPLPTGGAKVRFTGPYGQVVYVARYGVLVQPRPPTAVMRPDVGAIAWE